MEQIKKYLPQILVMVTAAWSIWPILTHPATAFFGGGDDSIVTWYLVQSFEKLTGNSGNFFDGNIFWPYQNTRSFGALLAVSGMIGGLGMNLWGTHAAAFNLAIIAAQFGTFAIFFWWLSEMTGDRWAAAVGTVLFGLTQYRFVHIVHAHMFIMQWLLLGLWFIWKYAKSGRIIWIYLAGAVWVVQVWENLYQAYWLIMAGVIMMITYKERISRSLFKHLAITALAAGVLIGPAAAAYYRVVKDFGYGGSIRESAHFAMSLNELIPQGGTWGLWAAAGLAVWINGKKKPGLHRDIRWLAVMVVFGIVMALGPVLKWEGETVKPAGNFFVPLPYGAAYYLLPGLTALRSVGRFVWLAAMGAAMMVAIRVAQAENRRTWVLVTILLLAVAGGTRVEKVGEFPRPENYPEVYRWLKGQPGEAILEYPVYFWGDIRHQLEMVRMVYSLEHRKSLIGGASGFLPPERGELLGKISVSYPNPELGERLKAMKVDYVVVHKHETSPGKVQEFVRDPMLEKAWENEQTIVFGWRD